MKKVVVFNVENVLFNFRNVEKWLRESDERMVDVSEFERMEEWKKIGVKVKVKVKVKVENGSAA